MKPSEIVDKVKKEGGFDTTAAGMSDTTVLGWVNEAYARMAEESKWVKQTREFGPTQAGVSQYVLPETVLDVAMIRVDGSAPWLRASTEQLWQLQGQTAWTVGAAGVFAPNFQSDNDAVVELYPAPTADGQTIEGLATVVPDELRLDSDIEPLVPDYAHNAIVDGAIAIGMRRIFQRHDIAASYEQKLDAMIQKLQRRVNSRIGSGPARARIYGVDL